MKIVISSKRLFCFASAVLVLGLPVAAGASSEITAESQRRFFKSLRPGQVVALVGCRTSDPGEFVEVHKVDQNTGRSERLAVYSFIMNHVVAAPWEERGKLSLESKCLAPRSMGGTFADIVTVFLSPAQYRLERDRKSTWAKRPDRDIEDLLRWGLVKAEMLGFLSSDPAVDFSPVPDATLGVLGLSPNFRTLEVEAHQGFRESQKKK